MSPLDCKLLLVFNNARCGPSVYLQDIASALQKLLAVLLAQLFLSVLGEFLWKLGIKLKPPFLLSFFSNNLLCFHLLYLPLFGSAETLGIKSLVFQSQQREKVSLVSSHWRLTVTWCPYWRLLPRELVLVAPVMTPRFCSLRSPWGVSNSLSTKVCLLADISQNTSRPWVCLVGLVCSIYRPPSGLSFLWPSFLWVQWV